VAEDTKPSRVKDVAAFLQKCREEYAEDARRDRIDREEAQEDNDFANSPDKSKGQWSKKAREDREAAGRPVLQFNRIPTYLQHIANAGRQNKPGIKITAGDNGTPETAEMLEARIRFIEYDSDASTVYDTARDQQVASGRGFIRILTEETEGGKQVARLARIENQFSVIWGPHRKYDASDADRCWVTTRISKAEHKRRFGTKSVLNQEDFAAFTGDEDWNNLGPDNEMVQIAEYFTKEYAEDGTCTACCYVINGREILEEGEFVVDDIPIVPQWGREAVVDGVTRHFSLHNPGKDWQRLINLYGSNIAEMIAAAPKDRFEAPIGSIPKNLEDAYGSNSPKSIRYYNQYDPDTGKPLNKPEKGTNEPDIQAVSVGLQQAIEGLKASMGIYDASMGQRSNETSGIAINRRKVEGEVTNYHFPGNEERTRKRVGQILIKMISVLDTPGSKVPIRHENGKTEIVPIGKEYEHPRTKKLITHVLTDADYAVEVESGPSYPNAMEQKQEAEQALIQAAPELLFTEVGVNMLRNSGRPGANEDADALERYINFKTPGLIPNKDEQPIPPQVSQQMQMVQQKLKTTEAFAQSLHEQIQTKHVEQQGKIELQQSADATKLEIAKMQEETKRVLGLAKIQSDEALAKLEAELGIVDKKVDTAHEAGMQGRQQQAAEHAHADASQATDLAHASASQGAQQEQEAAQAEANREAEPVGAEK
jgi:hypothetical protein